MALVALARAVLGNVSADEADALAATEAWAGGEASDPAEFAALYTAARGEDERGEAICWALSAAFDRDETEAAWCVEQGLATLAAATEWHVDALRRLHGEMTHPPATHRRAA
ncbi:hypothetical protein BE21_02485 [Sorangium cellulosum]|uniref:Uncharacterized protein n=1 Tax=Sorangium cellulosum TaxID=56 RepID=A0A150TRT3_SORCE|nr:hypothetical protein BE21_02485 [Sorangium cellulosum]